jgi:hypothetical protein
LIAPNTMSFSSIASATSVVTALPADYAAAEAGLGAMTLRD